MTQLGNELTVQEFDQIIVLVKSEATYSDDSIPAPAEYVEFIGNPQVGNQGNKKTRDVAKSYWGSDTHQYADLFTTLTGDVHIAGPGAAGSLPGAAALLRACGMLETQNIGVDVQYSPASESLESVSVYDYHDKEHWKIVGMRGNSKLVMKASDFNMWNFAMTGLDSSPIDAASIPAVPDLGDAEPLILNFANTPTATFFGQSVNLDSFEFDPGNVISPRDRPGEYAVRIKNRSGSGSITFSSPLISVQDIRGMARSKDTGAIQVVQGVVAGEIFQVDLAKVQMDLTGIQSVDMGDNEKGIQIPFDVLPIGGDDEWLYTFK